jgi:hypothetical protein
MGGTHADKAASDDDANAGTGEGSAGPGDPGFEGQTTVGAEGGGDTDMEAARQRMADDPSYDPAEEAAGGPV